MEDPEDEPSPPLKELAVAYLDIWERRSAASALAPAPMRKPGRDDRSAPDAK